MHRPVHLDAHGAGGAASPGRNWAGTYTYRAERLHQPRSVEELQELVASSRRIKAMGTRHSFNDIADSAITLVELIRLPPTIDVAEDRSSVTVAGGVRYGHLAEVLQAEGLALHNMGSLPHISVAGACATASHGSGDGNGNLATAVTGIELVTATGELLSVDRSDDRFHGMVVNLGALGVVTRLVLAVEPTYDIRQDIYLDLSWDAAQEHLDAIPATAYSVGVFTNWGDRDFGRVWLKSRIHPSGPHGVPPEIFGATPASAAVTAIAAGESTSSLTPQRGVPGPWCDRLPHFRLDATPSNGNEIQSEYVVSRAHAVPALRAVYDLRELITPHLIVSEIRSVAADQLWLSPAYDQDAVCIHFTWRNHPQAVNSLLPVLEGALEPFGARPHWGKSFAMSGSRLETLYERLPDFRALAESLDPDGTFRNAYTDRVLGLS